jgi:hypothetical protein
LKSNAAFFRNWRGTGQLPDRSNEGQNLLVVVGKVALKVGQFASEFFILQWLGATERTPGRQRR